MLFVLVVVVVVVVVVFVVVFGVLVVVVEVVADVVCVAVAAVAITGVVGVAVDILSSCQVSPSPVLAAVLLKEPGPGYFEGLPFLSLIAEPDREPLMDLLMRDASNLQNQDPQEWAHNVQSLQVIMPDSNKNPLRVKLHHCPYRDKNGNH